MGEETVVGEGGVGGLCGGFSGGEVEVRADDEDHFVGGGGVRGEGGDGVGG